MTRKLTCNSSLSVVAQRRVSQPRSFHSESRADFGGPKSNPGGIMKTRILHFYCLLLLTCARGQTVAPATHPRTPAQRATIVEGYGRLPLTFEANQGQTDPHAKFVSRGAGHNLFLTTCEAVVNLDIAPPHATQAPRPRAPPREEKSLPPHM